jgi:hypothetical protein
MILVLYALFAASAVSAYGWWIFGVRRDLTKQGHAVSDLDVILVTGRPMMEDLCKWMEVCDKRKGVPASALGLLLSLGVLMISFLGLGIVRLFG